MMNLGNYFWGIVTFSVVINLIGMIYPNDKSGVRKALDICLSLCLLCAVIAPIGGMVARAKDNISLENFELPDVNIDAERSVMTLLAKESEKEIEDKLFDLLSSEFGEDDMEIDADVVASEDGVVIECVKVYLYGGGILIDPRDVSASVARYTDAQCRVIEGRR